MTNTATTTSVWKAVCTIVGDESAPFDEHASLFDMGLDSLGLAELVIQLEEQYGEGAITIDDVLANPIVSSIAAHLVLQAASCTSQAPSRTSPAAASPAVASTDTPAARAIFLFAGEGAHSAGVDLTVLKTSPSWLAVDATIFAQHGASADDFLAMHLGDHTAPYSPVVTTILNILQADLWKLWGHEPSFALGHSVGEIGAAYACGMVDVSTALRIAFENGVVAAAMSGKMLHTTLPAAQLSQLPASELHLAAVNHGMADGISVSVTLCGTPEAVAQWLSKDDVAIELKPIHPWHHAAYATTNAFKNWGSAARPPLGTSWAATMPTTPHGGAARSPVFVSSVTSRAQTDIDADHWKAWLTTPVQFSAAMGHLVDLVVREKAAPVYVVQMGAHPVLDGAVASLSDLLASAGAPPLVAHVSSMRRRVGAAAHLCEQRELLDAAQLLTPNLAAGLAASGALTLPVGSASVTLDPARTYSEQGVTSAVLPRLVKRLAPFFPGLATHDLYAFPTVAALVGGFDRRASGAGGEGAGHRAATAAVDTPAFGVLGWGVKLPANVNDGEGAWSALRDEVCAISSPPAAFKHCPHNAGYLHPPYDAAAAAASAKTAGVDAAEAAALDPQHALALELVQKALDDAGSEAVELATADRERIGVYLSAWQPPADDAQKKSAYAAIGGSLSALAARVANCFDLHGPAITVNTACSGGLVAVDTALRDLRAGRIDYAVVGGVNLIASSPKAADSFAALKRATMLSPTARCHTFSAAADGYVRSEGGVVFLLQSSACSPAASAPPRAVIVGSAVNQNTQRKPMTAVDPVAQERVVRAACRDAGIAPSALSAIELHGTGTKLGDPVELSALARVTAAPTADGPAASTACTLTAAKMHFGHLESAAGALGLLKACLMLQKKLVPPFEVDAPGLSPALEPIIACSRLALPEVGTGTTLPDGACVGVSSFGFAGSNAHIVVAMAGGAPPEPQMEAAATGEAEPTLPVPRTPARLGAPPATAVQKQADAREDAGVRLEDAEGMPLRLAGGSGKAAAASTDKSRAVWMAVCAIVGDESAPFDEHASLFDMGLDSLGLAELVIQLEEKYGEGAITIDDVLANPIVSEIAACLGGVVTGSGPGPVTITAPAPNAEPPKPPKPLTPTAAGIGWSPLTAKAAKALTTPASSAKSVDERIDQLESVVLQLTNVVKALTPLAQKTLQINNLDDLVDETPSLESVLATEPPTTPIGMDMCSVADECDLDGGRQAAAASGLAAGPPSDWILTTHVGSLPRATGTALAAAAIIEAQMAAGLSVINDGEWSRENYIGDLLSRVAGVGSDGAANGALSAPACLCDMPCAADMRAVPTYAQRFTGGNGLITLNPNRVARADVACTAMPCYLGGDSLMATLAPFLEGLQAASRPVSSAFWTVPSPGTLALFCEDRFFSGDHTRYVNALAAAIKPEFEAIAKTGLILQVDCPDLAMGRHTRYTHMTDEEFDAVAAANVVALNMALEKIPPEQVRIHVCWGNYAGPHHLDVAAYCVWPHVAKVHCKYVLIEGANPRHGHEVDAFEHAIATGIVDPTKLVVVPGVIDTTAARVEHPSLVAERLLRFVKAAGHPSRVMASTDCGFASTARSVAITADLAWRKIGALVEGAALASRLYMQAQAPVPMKAPSLTPTPYRACLLVGGTSASSPPARALIEALGFAPHERSSLDVLVVSVGDGGVDQGGKAAFERLRWAVDFPLALVAYGATPQAASAAVSAASKAAAMLDRDGAASRRPSTVFVCAPSLAASVVPRGGVYAGDGSDAPAVAALVTSTMLDGTGFDRRTLAPGLHPEGLPAECEVVVIGGGLLGMVAAKRLLAKGHKVVILEQRTLVGGIWSMHANSTSQVNSSEGGYCLKEFLPESSPRKHAHNRDHSTAAEVLHDLAELGASLKDVIHTQVEVVQVLGTNGAYHVVCTQHGGGGERAKHPTKVIQCSGVVLAINDRVGLPRPLTVPGMEAFRGVMADGTSDLLKGTDWTGKRVVVFGMGAFAVENVRTALEGGAAHVTVVARRLGTVCPKMIDYLNFVKPWDAHYRHETSTNVKQLKCWRDTYSKCGAATPEVWPAKIKHEGHTISVSDIWFVAHHMGKLTTHSPATLERMSADGCVLSDGTFLPCDVVVGCIGFERNTTFCEQLTGRDTVMHSNYLDKNMIYLADAEIDESAFNSFFGSSVLEYAKFYTNVYVEGLERPDALGPILWGPGVQTCPVKLRKWTQYIAVGAELIEKDPACAKHAADQVVNRTTHFYRTMPPATFVEVNRAEWEEIHTRLNGGVAVPKERQLPYEFGAAASWCTPAEEILGA